MANLKNVTKKTKAQAMGMHSEVLTGRTQQKFFNPDEAENFYYFGTYDVDFNKRTDLDVKDMTAADVNKEIGTVDIVNKIDNNQRASAIDAIHDMLFGKASQAMADYKKVVANTFFDEPTDTEIPNNETDNGTD